MGKEKELAYLMLEPQEANSARKDVLTMEMNLLHSLSKINNYKRLRKEEINTRIELKKLLGECREYMAKIMEIMPEVEKPFLDETNETGKTEDKKAEKTGKTENVILKKKSDIEKQLKEIRERLEKLDKAD